MTREELLQRGYCCGQGCKECPYWPKHQYQSTVIAQESIDFKKIIINELAQKDKLFN